MVLESVGLAGVAGGLHSLFSYNRENFMFDREMRQKQEFQILAFRNKQAELWREDIRDIIGMTEKKMDSYLVIATLQLGMCVGLFCEGRLEPGTPPWLLAFYMLALGGAFMYLLMAVWFAMHASVVANCSSVRLLTQFVRLPVPTWEHLEDLRTYASAYESVDWQHMLRVPFTGNRGRVSHCTGEFPDAGPSQEPRDATATTPGFAYPSMTSLNSAAGVSAAGVSPDMPAEPGRMAADPWGLERHGHRRDLYELEDKHPSLRAHVGLARKAAVQYQCFDAYARVAMTFGTNQLLNAVAYYCVGYLAVQDGAIWPSWCIVVIMVSIMITLISVDITLSSRQRALAVLLQLTGPMLVTAATTGWVIHRQHFEKWFDYLLPVASASHGFWLFWVLGAIGIEKQDNGSVLPMNFRAVLYLDVFGWLSSSHPMQRRGLSVSQSGDMSSAVLSAEARERRPFSTDSAELQQEMLDVQQELRADVARWRTEGLQQGMSEGRFGPTTIAFGDGRCCGSPTVDDGARGSGEPPTTSNGKLPGEVGLPHHFAVDPDAVCSPASPSREPRVRDQEATASSSPNSPALEPECAKLPMKCREVPRSSSILGQSFEELGTPMVKAISLLMHDDPVMAPLVETQDGLGTETPKDPAAPSQTGPRATHSVRLPPKHAFDPRSYAPAGVTKTVTDCGENEDIVAGHESIHPGKLPAKVFRLGTAMIAVLWMMGVAYPSPRVRGLMTTPALGEVLVEEETKVEGGWEEIEVQGAMGTDPNGLPMFIPLPQRELPALEEPELVDVKWPLHAGFFPRALTCDDSGKRLLVADDIGLYAAELEELRPDVGGDNASSARQLRGSSGTDTPGLVARFERVDRCSALEGQALNDVTLACTGPDRGAHCRALVLLAVGPTLVECPVQFQHGGGGPRSRFPSDEQRHRPRRSEHRNWTITHEWLHREVRHERVESLAVNSDCLQVRGRAANHPGVCSFEADEVGCVVVGTSLGRILQLRGGMDTERLLVPERSVHQRPTAVTHGSLHVLASGTVVALSRKVSLSESSEGRERKLEATAQAFDGEEGKLIGQWELPKGIDWLTLSAGGGHLFALGLRDHRDLLLYRFPVPVELRSDQESST